MSEISQWTQNNPFEETDSPLETIENTSPPSPGSRKRQGGDGLASGVRQSDCVDMEDFHSLGGSMDQNSLDM